MAFEAGTAFLQVVPSFAGVVDAISEEFAKDGEIAGKEFKLAFEEAARSPTVNVDVDTGAGQTQLAGLEGEALAAAGGLALVEDAANDASGIGGSGGGGITGVADSAEVAGFSLSDLLIPALGLLATTLIPIGALGVGALATLPAVFAGVATGAAAVYLALKPIELLAKLAFDPLIKALTPLVDNAILPGVAAGLNSIAQVAETLAPFVETAAAGIGSFVQQVGALLNSGEGITNLSIILAAGGHFMDALGDAATRLLPALLTIAAQASPFLYSISNAVLSIVNAFARWVSNGGFETFMRYIQANGPAIAGDISAILGAVGTLIVALAPFGLAILNAIGSFARFISAHQQLIDIMVHLAIDVIPIVIGVIEALLTPIFLAIDAIEIFGQHWSGVWNTAVNTVSFAVALVKGIVQTIGGFFGAIPGEIAFVLSNIGAIISGPFLTAESIVSRAVDDIVGFIKGIPGRIAGVGASIGSGLLGDIKGAGGSALSFATFGLLADGGPASAGTPYIVGEEGPELFVPGISGTVIPNHQLGNISAAASGGGQPPITQNISVAAFDPASAATILLQKASFALKTRGY